MARTRVVLYGPGVARVEAAAGKLALELAQDIANDMRRMVAVLTGALRGSIRVLQIMLTTARIWFGDVAKGIDYHLYVEYGTSRMAAQPYARPAVYRKRG